MQRIILTVLLIPLLASAAYGRRALEIIFIDVEGGASTLVVTPAGQSLLIDAGYGGREGRDPARILDAAADAGINRIDYLLATHFHNDHVGGVPDLAARIPIGTFIDYGEPIGTDRMAIRVHLDVGAEERRALDVVGIDGFHVLAKVVLRDVEQACPRRERSSPAATG